MSTRTVTIHSYIALIELAMHNGFRTPSQQLHLIEECRTLDNVFVDWSAWAASSWLAKPCERCEGAIDVTDGEVCVECKEYERTHPLDLPGLCGL